MKDEPFDIDAWLRSALEVIDGMVASGAMPPDQAQAMRARAPMVRARHFGEGAKDWADALVEGCERNLNASDLAPDEKRKEIAAGRAPHFLALLRLYGSPSWLTSARQLGERGQLLAHSSPEDIALMRDSSRTASEFVTEHMGEKLVERRTPSARDADHALFGALALDACVKFGGDAEDQADFLRILQLQALSISLANRETIAKLSGDDCAMSSYRSGAVWAKNGFPFVHIRDAAWASRLGATGMPPELASMIRPPWSCFRLAIPEGLLSIDLEDGAGGIEPCTRLMVLVDNSRDWTIILEGDTKMMHLAGHSTEQLCEDIPVAEMNITDDSGLSLTKRDGRVMRVAARLVLAACAWMDRKEDWPVAGRKRLADRPERSAKDPVALQYVLRPPVRVGVDARQALRAYIEGTKRGSTPSVRVLVRGHWKMQPHGPGNGLRKFIHREPYWSVKDPSLPIALRPHILTEPKKPDGNEGESGAPPQAAE